MVSTTITSSKTTKKAIDFRSSLVPSGTEHFAALHGLGGKNGRRSTIKVCLCDFSDGTGKGVSHTVSAHLSIDTMAKLYEVARQAILPRQAASGFSVSEGTQKTLAQAKDAATALYKELNGKAEVDQKAALASVAKLGKLIAAAQADVKPAQPDRGPVSNYSQTRVTLHITDPQTGLSPISQLMINRQPLRQNGEVSRNPWTVKVVNGKGKALTTQTGGVNYDTRSFQKEEEVSVMLNDDDMFRMMDACRRYITVWENSLISQVLEGIGQLDAEHAARYNNG